MKPFLLLLMLICINFSQAQTKKIVSNDEEFILFAKPDKTNKLSKYFSNRIDSKLFESYKVNDTLKDKKSINLTFTINEQNKAANIIVNSPYSELNKSIRDAFKNYDLEDLNITDKNPLNIYTLQILSKEGDQMVINCSTEIVYDRAPVFEGCESSFNQNKRSNCFYQKISTHIANNLSPAEIKKAKILGMLNLRVAFSINEQGAIEQINCKAPTDSLTQELNRVIALFPKAKMPATRNGKPTSFLYKKNIGLTIESQNVEYKEEIEKHKDELINSSDTLLSSENELALHFKNQISQEQLSKIVFPLTKSVISLSFNIDKKGNPVNIKTNAGTPQQNSMLVSIFNKFPFEKLNIQSTNTLEIYRYTLIIKRYDKTIIKCNDKPIVFIPPFFNKHCEKLKSSEDVYNSLNENISSIIKSEFKRSLPNSTKLSGIIKISCSFQIDSEGKIINVKGYAPNPIISNKLEEIIKNITSVYKPAYLNGKAISTNYKYTYRFDLGENKIDVYENLTRTNYSRKNGF